MLLFDHFLGPNNVGNMASAAETKLTGTLYNFKKKISTWETYVQIHTKHHSVPNGLKDYGYASIDDQSKVRNLLKGIKITELDVCKTQVMAGPSLRNYFASTFELYFTFIKKIKAINTQMFLRSALLAGRGAGTRLASEVPLEFQMFQTLQSMTVSLISINMMLSHLSRRMYCVSSA
jgi:hypothetical protein